MHFFLTLMMLFMLPTFLALEFFNGELAVLTEAFFMIQATGEAYPHHLMGALPGSFNYPSLSDSAAGHAATSSPNFAASQVWLSGRMPMTRFINDSALGILGSVQADNNVASA